MGIVKTAVIFFVCVAVCSGQQGCPSACCDAGGWCGDGVFDECEDGSWDYSTRCSPTYLVCCKPYATISPTTSTDGTTDPEATSPSTNPPNCQPNDECCASGGWCGDALFDDCDHTWDYGIKCPNPILETCCIDHSATATTTQGYTGTYPPFECGQRLMIDPPEGFIVGGEEAVPHSWPWMVSLELDYFGWGGWEHYCGGSLIDRQWILTAAHCIAKSGVNDPQYFRVKLGMHNKDRNENDMITMGVDKYVWHEDYSTDIAGSPNDIALVKLASPVMYTPKIAPICLPQERDLVFLEQNCTITGWGLTKGTANEDVLNEAAIEVITNEVCDFKWEAGSGRVDLIKESHICAGNGVPAGTCNGDSGGPLQCEIGGEWVLAGATSFGASGCLAEDAPDCYTRISHFLDWIQDVIDNN